LPPPKASEPNRTATGIKLVEQVPGGTVTKHTMR